MFNGEVVAGSREPVIKLFSYSVCKFISWFGNRHFLKAHSQTGRAG